MNSQILILNIVLTVLTHSVDNANWDYSKHGPDVWKNLYSECGGYRQSPVNIQTACTTQKRFEPFRFESIYNQTLNFILQNDGHTVRAKTAVNIPLYGGNIDGYYQFVNFHIHWGPNENVGSEHQVNGDKYTGECHFVYQNVALQKNAVLSFLMKNRADPINTEHKRRSRNTIATMNEWKRYFDATQSLVKENDSIAIDLNLSLLMGDNLVDFWRYEGSLTTPPCTQNVIWTIFKEPIEMFDYEFDAVRHDLFFESFRGPQPLFNRTIYRSFEKETLSPIPDQNCCINKRSKGYCFHLSNQFIIILLIIKFILI